jgi:dTDP-4-amino-4,6-dideoxy-D-galactose acyltransferase
MTKVPRLPPPYLPYPFLKRISDEKRQALWSERFQSFSHSQNILQTRGATSAHATFLPWDSVFFKKPVYRLDWLLSDSATKRRAALGRVEREARAGKGRYLFAVVPTEDALALDSLGTAGWSVIETRLTYWHGEISTFRPPKRFSVRPAKKTDLPSLRRAAIAARNPFDRFHADPFFGASHADRLMSEWVRASVCDGFADVSLVPSTERPQAIHTLRYLESEWRALGTSVSQIAFTAVSPKVHGWYPKLLSESLVYFRNRGTQIVTLTTQAANRSVIRTLERYGFSLGNAQLVLRKIL